MAFQSTITEPYENEHETRQFKELAKRLNSIFSVAPEPHYLFGNVICDGTEVDAIFVKRDAVCLIEMKSMGGEVHFSENGAWQCDGRHIKSGKHSNPYRQINAYRHTVRSLLNDWERNGDLKPNKAGPWGHISTLVVFGPPCEIIGEIPENITKWFQIEDLSTVANALGAISSPLIDLRDADLVTLCEKFGGISKGAPRQSNPDAGQKSGKLVFDRKANIGKRIKVLQTRKGNSLEVARKFEAMLREPENWHEALNQLPSKPLTTIPGGRIYRIDPEHTLVVMTNELFSCPLIIGVEYSVNQWLKDNKGMTYVIDPDLKIEKTYIGGKGDQPNQITDDKLPLLKRIDINLETLVPNKFVREGLLDLTISSDEQDIEDRIGAARNESVRNLLSDIIYRIRSGDAEGANARLQHYLGNSIEVEDMIGSSIDQKVNSDLLVEAESLSQAEWDQILDPKNFADWMVFLHPDQLKIAHAEYQQRALLTGVSGSGKTCVLVHRARYLARKYPGQRIGILTLNRNLSHLLDNLVSALCPEEKEAISVCASYDYFKSLVDHLGPEQELENLKTLGANDPEFGAQLVSTLESVNRETFATPFDPLVSENAQEQCWDKFLNRPIVQEKLAQFVEVVQRQASQVDPIAYLREEFSLIRSGCLTETRTEEYLDLLRVGRAIRLYEKDRVNVLSLLLLYEETMLREQAIDDLGLTLAVTPHMKELANLPDHLKFRCLLIDEFQDLSTRDLAVLQRIVPSDKNALFLTGDMVQQVMVKTLSLPKVGFVRGSYDFERIRKNYRNSRQVLLAANDLVIHYGQIASEQNEEIAILDPDFAIRETTWPCAISATEKDDEIAMAWQRAERFINQFDAPLWSVCVVTASPDYISIKDIINGKPDDMDLAAEELTGDYYAESHEAITVGNMADIKGFEFAVMIIVGCGEKVFPSPGRASGETWRDALRLYVAMTRARDEVYLIHSSEPSQILNSMSAHLDWEN